jgi:hypothetical protein
LATVSGAIVFAGFTICSEWLRLFNFAARQVLRSSVVALLFSAWAVAPQRHLAPVTKGSPQVALARQRDEFRQ